ncbi:hypothetical protein ACXYMO_16705 [Arenibacterium sp. CAU 1754]
MTRPRQLWLAMFASVALAVGLLQINPAVTVAERSARDVAATAGVVYVSLRVINAALSTAQEIEVGASFGAQATAQPLKVLEPVDDTVERVASVVFAVAAGAALATVGLGPVAALGALLAALGFAGLILCARVDPARPLAEGARRAVVLGLGLSVLLPTVFAVGITIGEWLTAPAWNEAIAQVEDVAAQAEVLLGQSEAATDPNGTPAADGAGWFGWMGAATDSMGDAVESAQRYLGAGQHFIAQADALFASTMTLIGVFILRMIVLPVVLLWIGVTVFRRSLG